MKGISKTNSSSAEANTLPHRTGRAGKPLAVKRFIDDNLEQRIQDKVDAGVSEEEARATTEPIKPEEILQHQMFLKMREVAEGGYGGHEPTIELAKDIVSRSKSPMLMKFYCNIPS